MCRQRLHGFLRSPRRSAQVTFADEACTPALAHFSHAATPASAFEALGKIRLQVQRHIFRSVIVATYEVLEQTSHSL